MPQNLKKYIVYDNKDDRPSRFLVDLNKLIREEENYSESKVIEDNIYFIDQKTSEIAKKKPFFKTKNNFKSWYLTHQDELSRLTLFPLVKLIILIAAKIIRLFFVLGYKIGWIAVFFIRFIGLISLYFVKFIHNLIIKFSCLSF